MSLDSGSRVSGLSLDQCVGDLSDLDRWVRDHEVVVPVTFVKIYAENSCKVGCADT